ncbi:MAG: hypothetical protein QOI73_2659 [Solirubrobacteraceae bacterium]|nr:hypothetical protein [Solirubrobacteraceae bacterium]
MGGMRSTSRFPRPVLVTVGEPVPWYATAPTSPLERRRELEDERSRLLALAVGDHLPVELAMRAADLTAQLQDRP